MGIDADYNIKFILLKREGMIMEITVYRSEINED